MASGPGLARHFVLALVATALVSCSGEPDAPSARGRYGVLVVDPPEGVLPIHEGETLAGRVRFEPGQAWPDGARLLVYPPATQAPKVVEKLPAELSGDGYRLLVEAYRSISVAWPGRAGRYVIRQSDGATESAGSTPFELTFETIAPRHYYGESGPCDVSLSAQLMSEEGEVLHEYETPRWTRALEAPARLRCILPSEARVGEPVEVLLSVTSWRDNPVLDAVGVVRVEAPEGVALERDEVEIDATADGVGRIRATFTRAGVFRLAASIGDEEGLRLDARGNPVVVTQAPHPDGPLLWGDLHNHSNFSFDTRTKTAVDLTPTEVIEGARRRYGMDFLAMTDHAQTIPPVSGNRDRPRAFDMPKEDWEAYRSEVLAASSPDIVTFWGFEQNDQRGHCVLINRLDGPFFVRNGFRVTYRRYWRMKKERDLLSIPHLHPLRGGDLFTDTSSVEPLIEIYSQHGAYESYLNEPYDPQDSFNRGREAEVKHDLGKRGPFVRQLLDRGFRYGFVACSDHANGGSMGLTAVRAASKTRDAIFDGLLARRTIATTGARMWMSFEVDGSEAGVERVVAAAEPGAARRVVRFVVHAQEDVARVQVVRNGKVWRQSEDVDGPDLELEWVDDEPLANVVQEREIGPPSAYYYLRVVQVDDHIGWSSPVFFEIET